MRRTLFLICFFVAAALSAQDMTGVKIYINPGHGGHDSDDRNMVIYPYTQGDPEGFWESNSNLHKGLMLNELLTGAGASTAMSRTTNTTADDRALSAIVAEANAYNADFMLSIHSNAGVNNYVLMLYAGVDATDTQTYPTATPCSDEGREISTIIAQNLYKNQITCWGANYTVRGDKTFARTAMGWSNGYGVLRGLTVPGVISEGCMHDYIPETYRLMNMEYKYMEAWNFFKTFCTYFKSAQIPTGVVAGSVRDGSNKIEFPSFYKIKNSRDEQLPLHGAVIYLVQGTDTIDDYTTDNLYNGVFLFKNVQPGDYKLVATCANYYNYEQNITVTADNITFFNFDMSMVRSTPPEVISYTPAPAALTDSVECSIDIVLNFNWDMEPTSTLNAFSITPEVEGTLSFENSQKTLRFTPNGSLETQTLYTVRLANTACHPDTTQPNQMVNDFTFQFVTKSRGNLSMLLNYPAYNESNVALNPSFIMIFDQELATGTVQSAVSVVDANGTAQTKNTRSFAYNKVNAPYGYVSFELISALQPNTDYKLVIGPDVADKIGITTAQTIEVPFRTGSADVVVDPVINILDTLAYVYDETRSRSITSASVYRNTSKKLYGTASNELKYAFADTDGEAFYASKNPAAVTATSDYVLGLHVFGDFSFNELWAEWSVDGDIKYAKIATLDYAGWQYRQVALDSVLPENITYQLSGLKLIHQTSFLSMSGSLYIDNMTLIDAGTALQQTDQAGELMFYPNPATNVVKIMNLDVSAAAELQLYSLSGTMVKSGTGNTMNVSDVAAGTYILRAKTAEKIYTSPVIITR